MVVFAWATYSLKGLFQPTKITAAIITISTNSRVMSGDCQKRRVRSMEFVTSLKRVNPKNFRGTRLYRARLSNQFVMFLYARPVESLKGVFQARAIRAAMITISINSRRMITETDGKSG